MTIYAGQIYKNEVGDEFAVLAVTTYGIVVHCPRYALGGSLDTILDVEESMDCLVGCTEESNFLRLFTFLRVGENIVRPYPSEETQRVD